MTELGLQTCLYESQRFFAMLLNLYSIALTQKEGITPMNKFTEYISSQFKNPHGFVGKIICIIQNILNDSMYKKAASLVDIGANEKVLDIGYGNGHLLELIYKKKEERKGHAI